MQILKNAEGEEIDRERKNYCVVDDSSKFAAAVYYHYINKEILKDKELDEKIAYGIDLWGTSSTMFINKSSLISKLTKTKQFAFYNLYKKSKNNNVGNSSGSAEDMNLQVGDLLCRNGNVEFYIGSNKMVGWGRIHKEYTIYRALEKGANGYFYDKDGENLPYTTIIRFRKE